MFGRCKRVEADVETILRQMDVCLDAILQLQTRMMSLERYLSVQFHPPHAAPAAHVRRLDEPCDAGKQERGRH